MKKKNIAELTRCSIDEYRQMQKIPALVVTDSVRSMHNVGAIFRTADAFLFSGIILCGISGKPPHPDLHKTALGAEDSVKWSYEPSAVECVKKLQEEGWKICVLEQVHNSIPLNEFAPLADEKIALVAGNEVEGVDQRIVDLSDYVVEIPQHGTKHSLNVSVSAALAMWQIYINKKELYKK